MIIPFVSTTPSICGRVTAGAIDKYGEALGASGGVRDRDLQRSLRIGAAGERTSNRNALGSKPPKQRRGRFGHVLRRDAEAAQELLQQATCALPS